MEGATAQATSYNDAKPIRQMGRTTSLFPKYSLSFWTDVCSRNESKILAVPLLELGLLF